MRREACTLPASTVRDAGQRPLEVEDLMGLLVAAHPSRCSGRLWTAWQQVGMLHLSSLRHLSSRHLGLRLC